MMSVRMKFSWRDISHRWPIVFAMMLLAVMLPICSLSPRVQAEEAVSATSSEAGALCKGLKPYNNLDELLYQFYINLDDDCLFNMPVEELEKIWDTNILSYDRRKKGETITQMRANPVFLDKLYESEKDAFYLEHDTFGPISFHVFITKEYYEKHATLFPDGSFPKLLPEPKKRRLGKSNHTSPPILGGNHRYQPTLRANNMGGHMFSEYMYFWLSSGKNRIIYLEGKGGGD